MVNELECNYLVAKELEYNYLVAKELLMNTVFSLFSSNQYNVVDIEDSDKAFNEHD